MRVTGGCHCGAIRFEAEVDPNAAGICHCTDCQKLSGTAYRVSIQARAGTFRLLAGTPRIYTKTADSGTLREQAFCERCGSPLYAVSPGAEPRVYSLRVGVIDERAQLRPALQIWARSRLPWLDGVDALPRIDGQKP